MIDEAQLDVVEVADEIVRTSRYGQRNYRNSVGLDSRRHWRDPFLVSEEHVESHGQSATLLYTDEEQAVGPEALERRKVEALEGDAADNYSGDIPDPEPATDEVEESEPMEEPEEESAEEATSQYDEPEEESVENTAEEVNNFFDPLQNVDSFGDILTEGSEDADERIDAIS